MYVNRWFLNVINDNHDDMYRKVAPIRACSNKRDYKNRELKQVITLFRL